MILLLTIIEEDRLQYTEQRAALKQMKNRFDNIEIEITDERAELVTTTGLLNQNDKLREQIQIEEREKMKIEFEQEMNKHKIQLDLEKQNVRETISSEIEKEMLDLRNEVTKLKTLLKVEQTKCIEYVQQEKLGQEYAEELEQRLADSEVEMEESNKAHDELYVELQKLHEQIDHQYNIEDQLRNELDQVKSELDQVKSIQLSDEKTLQESINERIEDAKFQVFTQLMDASNKERQDLINNQIHTQKLLNQAIEDIEYLSKKNIELTLALDKAMYYEPLIR